MREIIFRGKRVDNGKWVSSGNIIHFNEDNQYFIPTMNGICTSTRDINDNVIAMENAVFYKVIPETVGQYTGLKDKNGKMIFEGDIVRCWDTHSSFEAVVEFGNPNCQYNWGWQLDIIKGDKDANFSILLWVEMDETGAYCEIIGNIHDNPELLKEGVK